MTEELYISERTVRNHAYNICQSCRMPGVQTSVKMDGTLEVGGTLVEEVDSCPLRTQYSTP